MSEDENSITGRWTNEEHEKFLLGLQLYGKDWKKIEGLIGSRSCSQVRSHAQKYFLKLKKQSKRKPYFTASNTKLSEPQSPSSNQSSMQKQQYTCSYFMNKILQFTRSHENLDIWDALIDSKPFQETVSNQQQSTKSKNMTIQENVKEET